MKRLIVFARYINNSVNERIEMFSQRWVNKIASMVIRNPDIIGAVGPMLRSAEYEK